MRLLDTEIGQFVDFPDEGKVPAYAILSHTWDPQGEQTYQELRATRATTPASVPLSPVAIPLPVTETSLPAFLDDPAVSEKVRMACVTARAHGHRYIWIDSCCIDKASSTELSEAINSMYRWYGKATMCYAFLADVSPDTDTLGTPLQIRRSRWFTRGWTLQELIAPRYVVFLSREWRILGSKSSLAPLLEEITGIERAVLTHAKHLDAVSVAARMSWASTRSTTRVEDEAYSLLGIFDINMPTLYGEGQRAFARLQEEIVRQIPDQSLFAWGNVFLSSSLTPLRTDPFTHIYAPRSVDFVFGLDDKAQSLFAPSPLYFKHAGSIRAVPLEVAKARLGRGNTGLDAMPIPSYTVSPYGMRTELSLLDVDFLDYRSAKGYLTAGRWFLAILACEYAQRDEELLARVCYMRLPTLQTEPLWGGQLYQTAPPLLEAPDSRGTQTLIPFSVVSLPLHRLERQLEVRTCYIPYLRLGHQDAQVRPSRERHWTAQCTFPEWQKVVLQSQGYAVTTRTIVPMASSGARQYHLTLSSPNRSITVEYQYHLVPQPHGLDSQATLSELDHGDGLGTSLPLQNADHLTVWLDAAVVPSSTSPRTLEPSGIAQEVSGPHQWVDFCAQRFEFPEVTLKTFESFQNRNDGGMPTVPSFVKVTRTIRLQVAVEPIAEADTESCSHHILVELVEDEQMEEVHVVDSPTGMDGGRGVKDEDKRSGTWIAKLRQRFKSQTRLP